MKVLWPMLIAVALGACATPRLSETSSEQILVVIDHQPQTAFLGDPSHPYRRHTRYEVDPAMDRTLNRLASQYRIRRQSGWAISALDAHCEIYTVPDGVSVSSLISSLDADPEVRFAQPMGTFEVMTSADAPSAYNDPYVAMQHALATLRVEAAHDWTRGSNVAVAVVDTGITRNHADLRNQVVRKRNFVPPKFVDNADAHHGTAVAGVIASIANNRSGIVGIAPEARLFDLTACWSGPNQSRATCNSLSLARALSAAIEEGVDVINLSLAGPEDKLIGRLVRRAFDAGAVLVAAAGPHDSGALQFPANMAEVLAADSVAHDQKDALLAPGNEILTTTPQGYDFVSGSSLSAAHVSGVVALLRSLVPALNAPEVNQLFLQHGSNSTPLDACVVLAAGSGAAVCDHPGTASLKTP